jgi:hypothetical protein
MKKLIAGLGLGAALAFAAPSTAEAQTQDGLVNVMVGDVTIAEDVNIAAAVALVVQLCGVSANIPVVVNVLTAAATFVDNRSITRTACTIDGDRVRFVQN